VSATKTVARRLVGMLSVRTAQRSPPRPWRISLSLAWVQTPRFVRNALISLPTFLLDLGLLYLLARQAHMNYLAATIVSFFAANGLGYFLARWFVFAGSKRSLRRGLIYFLAIATFSAFALMPLMWLFVSLLHLDVVVSRAAAASIVGIGGYLLNLTFNFRLAGGVIGPQR